MQAKRLSANFSVSGQITASDIADIAAAGFTTVINNRPDGEAPDQPTSAEVEAAAARYGLTYVYIPVTPGDIQEADARRLADAISVAPGPAFAFCRSGARSTNLWNAAQKFRLADLR